MKNLSGLGVFFPKLKKDVKSRNATRVLSRYSTRGVDLPRSVAQTRSIELVKAYAEADQAEGPGVSGI